MRDIFSGERVLSGSQSTVARSVRPELNNNNNNFKMSVMNDQEAWGEHIDCKNRCRRWRLNAQNGYSIVVHLHSCKKTGKQNKRSRVSTVATSTNFVVRAWTIKNIFDIAINIFNVRMIINSFSVKLAICIVEPLSEVGHLWIFSHHPSEVNFEPQLQFRR